MGQGRIELRLGDRDRSGGRGAGEGDVGGREAGVALGVRSQRLGGELDLGAVHRDGDAAGAGAVIGGHHLVDVIGVVLAVQQEEQRHFERDAPAGPVDAHQVELEVLFCRQPFRPEASEILA